MLIGNTTCRRMGGAGFAVAFLLSASLTGSAQEEATFTRDVAPILQQRCQTCHRTGQMAPMSLVTYDEVRPWARAIRSKVAERSMPPWHIDKTIGIQEFDNDISLSEAEIGAVVRWVDAGAPRGNPADMPPPIRLAVRRDLAPGGALRPAAGSGGQLASVDPGTRGAGPVVAAGRRDRG